MADSKQGLSYLGGGTDHWEELSRLRELINDIKDALEDEGNDADHAHRKGLLAHHVKAALEYTYLVRTFISMREQRLHRIRAEVEEMEMGLNKLKFEVLRGRRTCSPSAGQTFEEDLFSHKSAMECAPSQQLALGDQRCAGTTNSEKLLSMLLEAARTEESFLNVLGQLNDIEQSEQ